MRPYYEQDGITIYHADCREVQEWRSADVLIFDPPYGIGWTKGAGIGVGAGSHAGILNDESTDVRDAVLALWGDKPWVCFASLRAAPPQRWKQALVFHKTCGGVGLIGNRHPWLNTWEPVFVGGRWPDQTPTRDAVIRTFETFATGYSGYVTKARHPHAKPVDVLGQIIECAPPGVIADPTMGSGATLVAAKQCGRAAIGVELDERHCETAARRLAQGALFGPAA